MWKLLVISLLLSLTGCAPNKPPVKRNQLHINFKEGDVSSLHPHELPSTRRGLSIAKVLFEGLTRIDAKGKIQLAGARRVEISPNGLHYLFHLGDNRWSNGMNVTASQYEAAWKKALASDCNCPHKELLYLLENGAAIQEGRLPLDRIGVKALGEKTLFVTLDAPCPDLLMHLSQPIFFPLFHCERKMQTEFNGPFLVAIWDKDERLCLKANPYFWNREKVSLQQIDVFMIQNPAEILALYEQQTLDWIGFSPDPFLADIPSLKGYVLDSDGAIDFSYASFQKS
jgi:oligopeptide transport system substrate-binding protein